MADEHHFPARRGPADGDCRIRFAEAPPGADKPRAGKYRTDARNAPQPPPGNGAVKPRRNTH